MSRIGKIPLPLPKEVKITITPTTVNVEGPKGKLSLSIPNGIRVEQKESALCVSRVNDTKQNKAKHGTIRVLLKNMIVGVTKSHAKSLEIQGLGFRAQASGQKLTMNLGFSHPVEYIVPEGVKVVTPKPNEIKIEGADKIMVGQVAAKIRDIKPPEPYKGKGIRYTGEFVRRKQGKSVTK